MGEVNKFHFLFENGGVERETPRAPSLNPLLATYRVLQKCRLHCTLQQSELYLIAEVTQCYFFLFTSTSAGSPFGVRSI